MKKIFKAICCLSLGFMAIPSHTSPTGYYFAGKVGYEKKTSTLNEKAAYFNSNAEEQAGKNIGFSLLSGYTYGLLNSFVLGGQCNFSYNPKDLDFNQQWEGIGGQKLKSNLEFKSHFSCGFDILAGFDIKGIVIFATGGIDFHFPQIRGSLIGYSKQGNYGAYFGKDETNIEGVPFPEVKSTFNFLHSWTFGGGLRWYLMDRLIIGIEAKYHIKKTKDLEYRYACYDPKGVSGLMTPGTVPLIKEKNEKIKVAAELKKIGVGIVLGLRL